MTGARWRANDAAQSFAAVQRQSWIDPDTFARLWDANWRKAKIHTGPDVIGLNGDQADKIRRGVRSVSKIEALAIAHALLQMEVPDVIGMHAAFRIWFYGAFGEWAEPAVSTWLELGPTVRLESYMNGGVRYGRRTYERSPTIQIVRAVDWIARCGPFVPFNGGVHG